MLPIKAFFPPFSFFLSFVVGNRSLVCQELHLYDHTGNNMVQNRCLFISWMIHLMAVNRYIYCRKVISDSFNPRSWFGPNGQYIRELPCPSCRGRGYTPCTECGIERSRADCSLCKGKVIASQKFIKIMLHWQYELLGLWNFPLL